MTNAILIYDLEIEERTFKDWSMAFADLETVDKTKLEGVSEFLEKGFTSEFLKENSAKTSRLIKTFKTFIGND